MKCPLVLLVLLPTLVPARAEPRAEQPTESPLAGTDAGKQKFAEPFVPAGGRLTSIEVNVGPKFGGTVVRGFRFRGRDAAGKPVEAVVGPADGKYERTIDLKEGVQVVGISGRYGRAIDSVRFHLSDGTASPPAGGAGGDEEFRLVLRAKDGKYAGRVLGLHGRADKDAVTGVGLLLVGRDGRPADLDRPEALELTVRGEVPAEFAPTVGRLTALYYECYPALLSRFDDPKRPASRHITLVFKRGMRVPAYCAGSEVSVSIEWLTKNPDDIALLTHELTHAVQRYPGDPPGWLVEGIADYARHLYGPKRQPGWQLPDRLTARRSYRDGYGTAAKFLLWLDGKHPGLVDTVHRRLQAREFEVGDFKAQTGKTLDELWAACVAESEKK